MATLQRRHFHWLEVHDAIYYYTSPKYMYIPALLIVHCNIIVNNFRGEVNFKEVCIVMMQCYNDMR